VSTPYNPYDPSQQQPGMPNPPGPGAPQGGYAPQDGYAQQGGYAPYPPQGGYAPYPPQGGYGYAPGGPQGYLQGGPVGFGEAINQGFRNMFNYQGRASRSAYWWFVLFELIAWVGVAILAILFAVARVPALSILLYLAAGVGSFLVGLSLIVRRLHDQDKSGFWYFISFVPLVGGIWLLVLTLMEGTPGPNRFG
jgi:uncharacterized membrane protein YhaH (DUF805 family)